jgi:predicted Zn-dependent peptidase
MTSQRFYFSKISLALVIIAWLFAQLAGAQTDESSKALDSIRRKVEMRTLPNGLRVIMYKRGWAPVFSGVVTVRVGGVDEKEGQTGISHMFEHMAFKGTQQIGTSNFEAENILLAELEKIMAQQKSDGSLSEELLRERGRIEQELTKIWTGDEFVRLYRVNGAEDMNATTSKELTTYMSSFPKTSFEFWCQTESDRLLQPVLRQFYQERDVVMEERRMRYDDSPEGKLYELLLATSYLMHPYRTPVIGYEHDLKSLTAAATEEFRKKFYVPNNIVVSVVGDIDAEKDFPVIEKYFGRLPAGAEPSRPQVLEPGQQGQREVILKAFAAPQAYLAYRKPNYPHPDDPVLGVMAELLVGSRSSPLYKYLVEEKKVVSSIDHDEAPGTAYPNLLIFAGVPKAPAGNDAFIKAFDDKIEEFKRSLVDIELLEIAKRDMAMDYLMHLQSSLDLAKSFASAELLHGGWSAVISWYESAMAVSPQDIQRVAREYLKRDNRTISKIEPMEEKEGVSAK